MPLTVLIVLSIHYCLVTILCLYGAHRIYHSLVSKRLITKIYNDREIYKTSLSDYPHITVQLPLYNEKFVAARIIDAAAKFNYPLEKLQIQVIDDSTDESVAIVAERN